MIASVVLSVIITVPDLYLLKKGFVFTKKF